jgi:hypothetical protein
MNAYFYILTTGLSTKIGITANMANRLRAYDTHNPNYNVYKTYSCDRDEARRVENHIKSLYRDRLCGRGKEWFKVSAKDIDRFVLNNLFSDFQCQVAPAMHGVELTADADELKGNIRALLSGRRQVSGQAIRERKEQLVELFAKAFGLGIPEHKLPEHIVLEDRLAIDFQHCDPLAELVRDVVRKNHIRIPHDDHISEFYHLIRIDSGRFAAISTARVSMPYRSTIEGKRAQITDAAEYLGWHATFHDDWSWHYPDETALVLFQQKLPVVYRLKAWETSFRKWVIEWSKVLKHEDLTVQEKLENTIEQIINDFTFPVEVASYHDFIESYIGKYWNATHESFYFKDTYEFLFDKWGKINA